jgi:hypothetical protein
MASLTATTAVPTKMYVRYGTSPDKLISQTKLTELGTSHDLALDPAMLAPGTTIYYAVYAQDAAGNGTQTELQSFTTKGLKVIIGVFDKNHKPLVGKEVTLHSDPQTVKTDKNGYATFDGVASGTHTLDYKAGSKTYSEQLQVKNNVTTTDSVQTAATQQLSVVYNFAQGGSWYTAPWFWVVLLLVAVAIVVTVIRRRRQSGLQFAAAPYNGPAATVGGSGGSNDANSQNDIAERLKNIPDSDKMSPGSTFSPNANTDTTDSDKRE